ncbi:hypothetical protein ACSS6W_002851 [Trichoderma asperelloides]
MSQLEPGRPSPILSPPSSIMPIPSECHGIGPSIRPARPNKTQPRRSWPPGGLMSVRAIQ